MMEQRWSPPRLDFQLPPPALKRPLASRPADSTVKQDGVSGPVPWPLRGDDALLNQVHKLHDSYEVDESPFGEGGYALVYKACHRSTHVVRAVKAISGTESAAQAQAEALILHRLDHPSIYKLIELFHDESCTYLVMEYVNGIDLFDFIEDTAGSLEHPREALSSHVIEQVLAALGYCHKQGVVHRDLKPENIMMEREKVKVPTRRPGFFLEGDYKVKLIDFGLAATKEDLLRGTGTASKSLVGTYSYIAPEVKQGLQASRPSDMWSAGMVLHALLLGFLPVDEVRDGAAPLDLTGEDYLRLSAHAKVLLKGLLQFDPNPRMTAAEALDACHIWCETCVLLQNEVKVVSPSAAAGKPPAGSLKSVTSSSTGDAAKGVYLTAGEDQDSTICNSEPPSNDDSTAEFDSVDGGLSRFISSSSLVGALESRLRRAAHSGKDFALFNWRCGL